MSDLLAELGLTAVNPETAFSGLKSVKPTDEAQIISIIPSFPNVPNTIIQYRRHNMYGIIKRNVRCSEGDCCAKSAEFEAWKATLPEDHPIRKAVTQSTKAQTRYCVPVVLYSGKTIQNYGGPIEVRYIDVAWSVWEEWAEGRSTVDETVTPYWQRDFIMKSDATIKGMPKFTHLETKAKWLTDATLYNQVMEEISKPEFLKNYVEVIPKQISGAEFLAMWESGIKALTAPAPQTAAQQAIQQAGMQPAIAQNILQQPAGIPVVQQAYPDPAATPYAQSPAVNTNVAYNSQALYRPAAAPTPAPMPAAPTPATIIPQPIDPAQMAQSMAQAPAAPTPVSAPQPQTIDLTNVASLNAITQAPAQQVAVAPTQVQPDMNTGLAQVTSVQAQSIDQAQPQAPAATPVVSNTEIDLSSVGNLDDIIASLPQ